jgi:ring-1,2-phenylacetyl-CoA epoxidase subunit PaaE
LSKFVILETYITFAAIMGKNTFSTLEITDVRKETSDTVSIALQIPADLRSDFAFTAGQYLTFKVTINGEEIRRAYSICSSPSADELRIAVKKVDDGAFSTFANESLKAGDKIEVMPPMGNFMLKPEAGKTYMGIAAGSGITPVMSMIKASINAGANYTLLYGSKTEEDIIFKSELDDLVTRANGKLKVHHVLSRQEGTNHKYGRVSEEIIAECLSDESFEGAFLCGPELMINTASSTLESKGYSKDKIHFELFTAPLEEVKEKVAYAGEKFTAQVTYIIDDEEDTVAVPSDGDSILDMGLAADLDLPFACKGGVCCTCKCQVKEGEVEMKINYALDDEEIAEGYVLACQSHPRTEKVVVDFDV